MADQILVLTWILTFVSVLGLLGVVAVVITLLKSLKHDIKASIGEICFDERWMGCFVVKTPRFLLGRNQVQSGWLSIHVIQYRYSIALNKRYVPNQPASALLINSLTQRSTVRIRTHTRKKGQHAVISGLDCCVLQNVLCDV